MAAATAVLDQSGGISLWERDGNDAQLIISPLAHLSVAHLAFPGTN